MLTFGQIFPLLAYFGVQASGVPTIRKIVRDKSTKEENPLVFAMLVVNGFVWSCYGILTGDEVICISNGSGIVFGIIYCAIFYQYCPDKLRMKKLSQLSFTAITVIFVFAFFTDATFAEKSMGTIGSLTSILLMSSPLATIRHVIRDQTSIYLPVYTVIATFINALSWLLYGCFVRDVFIWFPNGVSLLAAIVQVAFLFIYEREHPDKPTVEEVGQLL
mmetsp:Transcript_17971/g.28413  ORF Transcript_17971/g.28413 Transcript_17971/m.28413 type:complete len:218 (+) Transcript_17971:38-691(+)